jgi:hypothetical protein
MQKHLQGWSSLHEFMDTQKKKKEKTLFSIERSLHILHYLRCAVFSRLGKAMGILLLSRSKLSESDPSYLTSALKMDLSSPPPRGAMHARMKLRHARSVSKQQSLQLDLLHHD